MADETVASLASQSGRRGQMEVSPQDRDILRRLAGRLAELAARPEQQEKRDLWYRHNALEPTRPVIFCDPENGWNEIIPASQLQCQGDLARGWEMGLRKEIFWGESMGDDKVVDAVLNVRHVFTETDWGMQQTIHKVDPLGAYCWDAPLTDWKDLDRLHFPAITLDPEGSESLLDLARRTFQGLLTVRRKTVWWWSLGMTWTLINLRGLTQVMMDMYDYPRQLHRLMALLRDGHLARLDFLESSNLLSLNNDNSYVGSGGFGFSRELPRKDFAGRVRTIDLWGFGESQETVQVSPEMFEEFVFPYQLPLLERFGLNCYGCCEPLHTRWHVVKRFPRLRRVSVSAWADLEKMAGQLGAGYVFSYKPNPADLARPRLDAERIRAGLRRAIEITRGCRLEIVMKDNHTLGGNPRNATDWCRMAMEEARRAS